MTDTAPVASERFRGMTAVVGATGLVGTTLLALLAERGVPEDRIIALAAEHSRGRRLPYGAGQVEVRPLTAEALQPAEVAFFATPNAVSEEWAPWAARHDIFVIDKSSRWRMDERVPLVVPEVNAHRITAGVRLVATPNCSTIPLVMVLHTIRQHLTVVSVTVSTYQAVSGTGRAAVEELAAQQRAAAAGRPLPAPTVYPVPITGNVLPQCDAFGEGGYTGEEWKLMRETPKILGEAIPIAATAVRVPVAVGHAESVAIQCGEPVSAEDVRAWLSAAPGIAVADGAAAGQYPTPLAAAGTDAVWVGRIRRDPHRTDTVHLFLACDNLRKGAALNGIQIMEAAQRQGVIAG